MTSSYSHSTLRDIMNRCFNGERVRNCKICPAHPNNGGSCCFGDVDEYDETDPHCKECLYKNECRSEVFDRAASVNSRTSPSRFTSRPNGLVNIGNRPFVSPKPNVRSTDNKPLFSNMSSVTEPAPMVKKEQVELTPFQHFLYICVWGIFEGLFVTAAEYMKQNRPDNRR